MTLLAAALHLTVEGPLLELTEPALASVSVLKEDLLPVWGSRKELEALLSARRWGWLALAAPAVQTHWVLPLSAPSARAL